MTLDLSALGLLLVGQLVVGMAGAYIGYIALKTDMRWVKEQLRDLWHTVNTLRDVRGKT